MQGQGQISCIIVGETPDIQFLGWRLSLGSAFIVLVSQYVSSDGLVGWKSSRLGANFYTPNVFAKEVGELSPKLLNPDNGKCKYPIDVIIISGISIGQFAENCKAVSRFANPQTTVLVNASFGCELEEVALNVFDKNCKCVMSIACDIECRQLSLGSYALVNDNNCKVYLGLTYTSQNDSDKALLSKNEASVREELDIQTDTNTNKLIKQLTVTKWVKVQSYKNPQEMAVKIWEMIIPKISLNILSVIYEQFDYDTLLKNKSNEIVFRDLVKELFDICYAQCNAKVETFMSETNTSISSNKSTGAIDFNKIVDHCKSKRKELIKTTVNEYPEYLSLPFESYCFYHRFEYPAHILLYQPILLAKKYNAQCSNLNFLYGFYSRLLSLSGLSIYGGRSESHISVFDKRVAEASNNSNNSGNGHKRKTKKSSNRKKDKSKQVKKEKNQALVKVGKPHPLWSGCRSNNELGLWAVAPPSGNELLLPDDLGNLYLAAENLNGPSSASVLSRSSNGNNGYSIGKPKSMDSDDHYSTAESNDGGVVVGIDSDDERLKTRNSGRNSGSGGKRGGYLDGSSGSMDVDDDEAETGSYYDPRAASTGTPSVNDSDDDYEEDDDDDYDYQEDDDDALEIKMSSRGGKFKNRELINKIRKKKGGALENMGVIAVPHFIKRFSPKTPNNSNTSLAVFDPATANDPSHAIKRPYTTTSLELQLRTGEHLIAKEYDDLHQQLTGPETDPSQVRQAHDNRRRTFANVEKQFWKLQRRHNMYNRNISRPKTGPYEDLLDHMDILRRSNANEILDFTTSRYGNAESCAKMQNDKNLILSLHESKLRASNKNKRKLRIGASSTS